MENMRREGFEFMVSAPQVLLRTDPETGKQLEPFEEVVIDVPNDYQGIVMEEKAAEGGMVRHKGICIGMRIDIDMWIPLYRYVLYRFMKIYRSYM